jgi:dTDP-4-amino-4,6-dideoxygalactose transaminase
MGSIPAINGGNRHIPDGTILPAPPTTDTDRQLVLQSLNSSAHAWGTNCNLLQTEWAAWNGNKHCIALTSGTAALHMALVACGVQAGDEVITPAYSWTSSVTCILHHNAIPVFVDIDPVWANIDPEKIEAAITPRTKAIIVVHLHGVPAPLDEICEIARRHGLMVIEDACQAHGATYKGRKVGTIGDAGAFSLNQNKMLSSGEGGLFVCDDDVMTERGRSLVLFGDFYNAVEHSDDRANGLGWMYRYNDLCAAYARAQLTQLDDGIAYARGQFAILREELRDLPGLILPSEPEWGRENGYNFVCHVEPAAVGYKGPANYFREAIVRALRAEGVPASVWQRRILPELAAVQSRNAYGNGSPWRESGSTPNYDPAQFPAALYHSATYFIISNLRRPNPETLAYSIAEAVRKVWESLDSLDIDEIAKGADISIYERGWKPHAVAPETTPQVAAL